MASWVNDIILGGFSFKVVKVSVKKKQKKETIQKRSLKPFVSYSYTVNIEGKNVIYIFTLDHFHIITNKDISFLRRLWKLIFCWGFFSPRYHLFFLLISFHKSSMSHYNVVCMRLFLNGSNRKKLSIFICNFIPSKWWFNEAVIFKVDLFLY